MINIRRGCFETNSSSVHSLSMCMKSEYDEWERGKVYYNKPYWDKSSKFLTKDEAIQLISKKYPYSYNQIVDNNDLSDEEIDQILYECDIYSYGKFFDDDMEFEFFDEEFTTPTGEEVVAFGYYGYDS